ncbi:hypothetical protein [Arcicella lustrica]|uniref:SH3 domain-containing protein n=1 Tax=Arcicella lustrica TaxID=2984196 RepID=A0ABU5SIX3_9BACT|nr:hypothetical protein [Arcicella sp. DC25W]MEA5426969.1 hypothetical protein [Arcicella sp. DC25W]
MRALLTLFCFTILIQGFGQSSQINKIESEIKKNANDRTFEKQIIDLNNDGKNDIIYLYGCGEPNCITVFLNMDGQYKEQLHEQCNSYVLWNIDNKKMLYVRLTHCCGESPYLSNRVFEFNESSAIIKENYVLTNSSYTENTHLLEPFIYFTNTFFVKVTIDNYNLRFSPSIDKLEGKVKETFTYACEDGTNIIAKIKIASKIKVLSEIIEKDRKWLFVEVENNTIAGKEECNPISFEFKNQKLRGWISDKYVTRE